MVPIIKCYFVDAFADKVFEGNPAGVCVLEKGLPDELMLNIAAENNLSETAFAVKEGEAYRLRWFTPTKEVDLCGHATLATAFVLANFVEPEAEIFRFDTLSGRLQAVRRGDMADLYEIDFPAYKLEQVPVTDKMAEAAGVRPLKAYMGRDLLCVFEHADDVITMRPDMGKVKELDGLLLQVTAPGKGEFDCVSRAFGPKVGIDEDPVCGSGHCHIIPYWGRRLGKKQILARQASARGGTLYGELEEDRVRISGHAVLYAIAELYVD